MQSLPEMQTGIRPPSMVQQRRCSSWAVTTPERLPRGERVAKGCGELGHVVGGGVILLHGLPQHSKELPLFQWLTTILGNVKTGIGGAYHAFLFTKYSNRYLAEIAYRFNGDSI